MGRCAGGARRDRLSAHHASRRSGQSCLGSGVRTEGRQHERLATRRADDSASWGLGLPPHRTRAEVRRRRLLRKPDAGRRSVHERPANAHRLVRPGLAGRRDARPSRARCFARARARDRAATVIRARTPGLVGIARVVGGGRRRTGGLAGVTAAHPAPALADALGTALRPEAARESLVLLVAPGGQRGVCRRARGALGIACSCRVGSLGVRRWRLCTAVDRSLRGLRRGRRDAASAGHEHHAREGEYQRPGPHAANRTPLDRASPRWSDREGARNQEVCRARVVRP